MHACGSTPVFRSTSAIPTAPGSAARMRTPPGCCASPFRRAPTSACTAPTTLRPWRWSSTPGRERPLAGEHLLRLWTSSSDPVTQAVLRQPLESTLHAYLDGTGLTSDPQGPLFRTLGRGTGLLTRTPLPQANAYAMIQRRAQAAGIRTRIGNHTFRATGITAYLKNGGTLEKAAMIANHASTRTTQLYDRRKDEVRLDEVEQILI